ncbi:MAG: isoprenylcysteine carboxylmethyltransferase family protein [bacterium]
MLSWSGFARPETIGPVEAAGIAIGVAGGALASWCILTFVIVGRGTPAPFDPPRRLVVTGPYRHVRNPMYIGGGLALAGAAVFFRSVALLGYAGVFLALMHAFVVWYEEPTLRRLFGDEYRAYRDSARRWVPLRRRRSRESSR